MHQVCGLVLLLTRLPGKLSHLTKLAEIRESRHLFA